MAVLEHDLFKWMSRDLLALYFPIVHERKAMLNSRILANYGTLSTSRCVRSRSRSRSRSQSLRSSEQTRGVDNKDVRTSLSSKLQIYLGPVHNMRTCIAVYLILKVWETNTSPSSQEFQNQGVQVCRYASLATSWGGPYEIQTRHLNEFR